MPAISLDQTYPAKHLEWLFLVVIVAVIVGDIVALPAQASVREFLEFWVGYWADRSTAIRVAHFSTPLTHAAVLWMSVFVGAFPLAPNARWRNAAIIASTIAPVLVLHEYVFVHPFDTASINLSWVLGTNACAIIVIASILAVRGWPSRRSILSLVPNLQFEGGFRVCWSYPRSRWRIVCHGFFTSMMH